ncbi:hypothetical protein [Puniceibacterium sediminis]|uniref:Uncharacterized protein n=1 Tax=Puniceibacterium sediminis TaxID=1608407 RepID=A0A238WEA7_9RHOB|nr:hypothetical protein [Puniceibacterium sediminis]SNR44691.1 hypothetical protein SAMN06265370_105138 [Puniceibacterium sediminis]
MGLEAISEIYMQFSVRKRSEGFIAPVLRPVHALRYLADCFEAGGQLLGMSGFHYLDNGGIQPDQSLEVDADGFDTPEEFLDRIGGVILKNLNTNVVFEIAFAEQNTQNHPPAT